MRGFVPIDKTLVFYFRLKPLTLLGEDLAPPDRGVHLSCAVSRVFSASKAERTVGENMS